MEKKERKIIIRKVKKEKNDNERMKEKEEKEKRGVARKI
jgi:hypothetical protein